MSDRPFVTSLSVKFESRCIMPRSIGSARTCAGFVTGECGRREDGDQHSTDHHKLLGAVQTLRNQTYHLLDLSMLTDARDDAVAQYPARGWADSPCTRFIDQDPLNPPIGSVLSYSRSSAATRSEYDQSSDV